MSIVVKLSKEEVHALINQLETHLCEEVGITIFDLRKITNKRSLSSISEARHILWYNLYVNHGIKSTHIERYFSCNRNNILKGIRQIQFIIKTNYLKKRESIQDLINTINGKIN